MLTFLKLFLLMFFVSCSTIRSTKFIEPQAKEYVREFIEDAETHSTKVDVRNLTLVFLDIREINQWGLYGYCDIRTKTIIIFKTAWDILSPVNRKHLVYHEMGHCVLLRKHVTEPMGLYSRCPQSIMTPGGYEEFCNQMYEKEYIHELMTNPNGHELSNGEEF
jgi:hypothetical protein